MVTMTTDCEPILASWKISEVLKAYPELLDVLVDLTPAFDKLRNPVLRRVQTRLVTVQQAAGIAGLDARELVDGLGPNDLAQLVQHEVRDRHVFPALQGALELAHQQRLGRRSKLAQIVAQSLDG